MCTFVCEDHETDRYGPKYIKSHLFKLWHKPYTKGPQGAGWPNLMQVPAVTKGTMGLVWNCPSSMVISAARLCMGEGTWCCHEAESERANCSSLETVCSWQT